MREHVGEELPRSGRVGRVSAHLKEEQERANRGGEMAGQGTCVTARVQGDGMGSSRWTSGASLVFSAGSPHMTHGRSSVHTWANQCRREGTVIGDNSVAVGSEGEGGDGGEGVEDEGRVWRSQ